MKPLKRKLFICTAAITIFTILLFGLAIALKSFVNFDAAKTRILSRISETTGGETRCDTLNLRFLPKPHFTITDVYLSIPKRMELNARSLDVYPDIFQLLKGEIKLSRLEIEYPRFKVQLPLPGKENPQKQPAEKDPIKTGIGAFIGIMEAAGPQAVITISNGHVTLVFDDAPDIDISGIRMTAESMPDKVSLNLECISTLSGPIQLNTTIDTATYDANGQLAIKGINARPLLHYFSLMGNSKISDTHLDLDFDFHTKGTGTLQSAFSFNLPLLEYYGNGNQVDLKNTHIKGVAKIDANSINVTFDDIKADSPRLKFKGFCAVNRSEDKNSARINIDLEGKQIDVTDIRKNMLAIAGSVPEIRTAFSIARKGYIPSAVFRSRINIDSGNWEIENIYASGDIKGAAISIPEANLDLENITGKVIYENQRVKFKTMSGGFSGVKFKKLDAMIDWQDKASISVDSSHTRVQLETFFPWLTSFEGLEKIKEFIPSAQGTIDLSRVSLSGPLTRPDLWSLDLKGRPKARLQVPAIKDFLTLSGGDITFSPTRMMIKDTRVSAMDADLTLSGEINGRPGEPDNASASLSGRINKKTVDWLIDLADVPSHLYLKPPVKLTDIQIKWSKKPSIDISGHMATAGGITILTDLTYTPSNLTVRNIHFKDGISDVTLSLETVEDIRSIAFSGILKKETLDRILADNKNLTGWIKGDMKASVHRHHPLKSTITGNLDGAGVFLRSMGDTPIEISRFSTEFNGSGIREGSADIVFAETKLHLTGNADFSTRGFVMDLDINADRINTDIIQALVAMGDKKKKNTDTIQKELSYLGTIRLRTPEFSYKSYKWKPLKATIELKEDRTDIFIERADICGISTPGRVHITPDGLAFTIIPAARKKGLSDTIGCFSPNPVKIEGQYDLNGVLELMETKGDVLNEMTGRFQFNADKGRIDKLNTLTQILSVLNITELFTGGTSDLAEKGFGYKTIKATGRIKNGSLILDEFLIDGNAMKLTGQGTIDLGTSMVNIVILAAPLKTVDKIVNKLPVINYIVGGSLLSVPLRIKGHIDDTKIIPIPPKAVGKGIMNMMKRVLNVPFKMTDSLP